MDHGYTEAVFTVSHIQIKTDTFSGVGDMDKILHHGICSTLCGNSTEKQFIDKITIWD